MNVVFSLILLAAALGCIVVPIVDEHVDRRGRFDVMPPEGWYIERIARFELGEKRLALRFGEARIAIEVRR